MGNASRPARMGSAVRVERHSLQRQIGEGSQIAQRVIGMVKLRRPRTQIIGGGIALQAGKPAGLIRNGPAKQRVETVECVAPMGAPCAERFQIQARQRIGVQHRENCPHQITVIGVERAPRCAERRMPLQRAQIVRRQRCEVSVEFT